jgi:hypothetical protein
MKPKYILYFIALVFLGSCKPNIEELSVSKGNADFTSYIAVGDAWSAGFSDAALYKSAQINSFPNILAEQFKVVGGGAFKQPLTLDDYGFGTGTGVLEPKLILGYKQDCLGATSLLPVYADVTVDLANLASIADQGPFNNIAVPGLKSVHIGVAGLGALNPYFGRFASSVQASVLDEIPLINASFFTLWLGAYDILSYGIVGGQGDPITPVAMFGASMQATLDALTANGAKGAVANIPNVLDLPFFKAIPAYSLVLTDPNIVAQLNGAYFQLNQMIKLAGSTDTIVFVVGPNPLVIEDAALPWGLRQIKPGERVLLSIPQDSLKCAGWGSQVPVPSYYILDAAEVANVQQAVSDYNQKINELIQDKPIALVDMNAILKNAVTGLVFDNINFNLDMVKGNLMSLDGIHFTQAGSAIIAHYFIESLNTSFKATIPQVIISDYPTVIYP